MNLVPIYEDTNLQTAERAPAKKEDLEKLKQQLTEETVTQQAQAEITQEQPPAKKEPIPKLPPRIP